MYEGGTWRYYHNDHLSGTTLTTDENGEVVQVLDYEPYGEQTLSLDYGTQGSPYSYTGKELDPSSGLYYYEARWYDPETGHFISTDPFPRRNPQYMIPDPARWNEYAYARGNPVAYNDPTGEGWLDRAKGYVVGVVEGAWNAVESAASVIVDPFGTAVAVGDALLDLAGTAEAIVQSAQDTWNEFVNGDDYEKGKMVGEVVGGAAVGYGVGKAASSVKILRTFYVGKHVRNQIYKRGWTFGKVDETIKNPYSTKAVRDTRHLPDGTQLDEPATAYYNEDGSYVVRNDSTHDIVQVSDANDPNWKGP